MRRNWKQKKIEIPEILNTEVEAAIRKLKNNKALGPDGITNEMIKFCMEAIIKPLTIIFNRILETNEIPEQWEIAKIILPHKKGDRKEMNNERPISLTSNMGKIFMRVLKNRIYPQLNENQAKEQAGFRRGYSTVDNIFVINQVIEKAREYCLKVKLMFIDYKKAFDLIKHSYLWQAMKKQEYQAR